MVSNSHSPTATLHYQGVGNKEQDFSDSINCQTLIIDRRNGWSHLGKLIGPANSNVAEWMLEMKGVPALRPAVLESTRQPTFLSLLSSLASLGWTPGHCLYWLLTAPLFCRTGSTGTDWVSGASESGTNLDGNVDVLESLPQVILLHSAGDVAQVEGGAGRVDVLIILTARLLEPVKAWVCVVFCQPSIRLTVLWQLKCIILWIFFLFRLCTFPTWTLVCLLCITLIILPHSFVLSRWLMASAACWASAIWIKAVSFLLNKILTLWKQNESSANAP